MIQSEHISREELLALLDSGLGADKTSQCEDHLQQCESCRMELDRLAAHSEVWQKTPRLLRPGSDSSHFLNLGSGELETRDLSPPDAQGSEEYFGYRTDSLLEPPKHPEMIGRIGRYDIEREVGRGGMGIVFKAHDAELNRPLAIKVLAPHLANHGPARKRFAQEAKAAAGVLHPNVIAVHDVSNEGKTPFIVMPFIAGSSLQALVDHHGPIDELEIVRISLQIAAGLTPAHSQGLVHRDIKPANILLENGANRVIITDFGLARAENDASMTRTGWLTGTPNYMSPEQTRGERLDNRSDLFSLGSLMYFLATGRLPFRAESPLGVLSRIQNDEATPVRSVNNRISKTLADIIHALLKKDVAARFQTAGDLHEVLEQHLAHLHQPDVAKPPKVIGAKSEMWKSYAVLAASIVLVIAAGGVYASGWLNGNNSVPPRMAGVIQEDDPSDSEIEVVVRDDEESSEVAIEDEKSEVVAILGDGGKIIVNSKPSDNAFGKDVYRVVSSFRRDNSDGGKFNSAMHALRDKEYDDAIALFKESIEKDHLASVATYNIGCALALKGDVEKSLEYLNRAVEMGFVDVEQFEDDEDLDSVRENEGEFQELMERVERLAESNSLVDKAKRCIDSDEMEEAIALCREALQANQDNADAMVNLGYALHVQGDLESAMQWHQRAAQSVSQAALGNYNVACVYAIQGAKEKAFEHLERALDAGIVDRLSLKHVENDSDLENLSYDERFSEFLAEFRAVQKPMFGSWFQVRHEKDDFMEMISADWDATKEVKGKWECRLLGDRVRLSLTQNSEGRDVQWGFSTEFDKRDFDPQPVAGTQNFVFHGEQGKLICDGLVKRRSGEGQFKFLVDEKYVKRLKEMGIESPSDALVFRLLVFKNDEAKYLANIKRLQGLDLDESTLGRLMIHNVEADLVEEYEDSELDAENHLLFLIWRVSPRLLRSYLDADLDLEEHKKFINQRVEPWLIKSYRKAGLDLEECEDFVTWRVEPSLLTRYQKAGLDLKENDLFIQQRVEPRLLKDYIQTGLELGKHKDLIQHRVEAKELVQYMDQGLAPTKFRKLLVRRVPAKLVKDYQNAGLDLKGHDCVLNWRIAADEVVAYKDNGFFKDKYKVFLKARVPASFLNSYKRLSLDPTVYKDFVQQRVPANLIKAYLGAGLDVEEYKDFVLKRIEPAKVLRILKDKSDE